MGGSSCEALLGEPTKYDAKKGAVTGGAVMWHRR
jgi:hypothetical protein